MRKKTVMGLVVFWWLLGGAGMATATVIDFTGGTAYLISGATGVTDNSALFDGNVDYYIEDGIRYDFIGAGGTVGDYYSINPVPIGNDVIHAHWQTGLTAMVITREDGAAFDLNYIDITSNTSDGGGRATGTELSYIANDSGYSQLLPPADWGFNQTFFGDPGDGVTRLWLDSHFDNVLQVTFTSQNTYCFGLDNFYIDEEPPPQQVPEPGVLLLLGPGLIGLAALRKKSK